MGIAVSPHHRALNSRCGTWNETICVLDVFWCDLWFFQLISAIHKDNVESSQRPLVNSSAVVFCIEDLVSEMRELRHKSGNGSNIIGVPTVEMGMVRGR